MITSRSLSCLLRHLSLFLDVFVAAISAGHGQMPLFVSPIVLSVQETFLATLIVLHLCIYPLGFEIYFCVKWKMSFDI